MRETQPTELTDLRRIECLDRAFVARWEARGYAAILTSAAVLILIEAIAGALTRVPA